MSDNSPKQVIVIRKDLNMRAGKAIAQGAHASMAALLQRGFFTDDKKQYIISTKMPAIKEWLEGAFKKVTCRVESEAELLEVYNNAKAKGLLCVLIKDAGLTEFHGVPTLTAVGIGPEYPEDIDPVTGHLKLL